MIRKLTLILAAIPMLALASCDLVREGDYDCGVWLEFVFDHNMEYTDAFGELVGTVDVFVFDAEGKYLFTRFAETAGLDGRKRMFLSDDELEPGNYKVLTVGGLTEYFHFTDRNGDDFVQGTTTLENVRLALRFEEEVAHEFPHLYYGEPVDIAYKADLSVWKVPLIRQTNRFHVSFHRTALLPRSGSRAAVATDPLYTFEIVTPETGAYDYLNYPIHRNTPLKHHPYRLEASVDESETGALHLTVGDANTMRLIEDEHKSETNGYRLTVRNTETGREVWSHDMLTLLRWTNSNYTRPDGTALPFQEYLDREGDWTIVIVHKETATEGFVVLQIKVNNWIFWEHPAGI